MTGRLIERSLQTTSYRWLVREFGPACPPERPAVIFVAGLGSGEYLNPHAERLATTRRVFVPDMPGFGDTRGDRRLRSVEEFADALLELIPEITGPPVDLLGNSFGTQVVLAAAARQPEWVRRMILIGPTFDREARRMWRILPRWLAISPAEPPALAASLARSYAKCGVRTPYLAFRAALHDRPEDRISGLPHPILLIRGSKDRIAPRAWLQDLSSRAPAVQVAEVPGVAHTVDFAAPQRAAALTAAFLDAAG